MKRKSKRENQSRFIDTIIALLFSLAVCYGGITGLQMIGTDQLYFQLFLEYKNKYSWIMEQEFNYQAPLLVVTVGIFVLMVTMTRKKQTGYKDASNHGAYGNAVFSDLSDVRDSGYIAKRKDSRWSEKEPLKTLEVKEGIILGMDNDELFIIPPESKLDNRNVLCVGSSGSSKGQAFVINNIINNKSQTLIVTDPKGELFGLTADIKRDQGYRVEQIDFLNLKGSRYNPLDYVNNDIEAIKIANAISINSAKDVKQDFFFNTARDLLTGLIIYAKAEFDHPNISKTVKGLFNRISSDENYLPNLCEEIGDDHSAYQYLKDASAQSGNTRASILSSFAQQTGVFSLGDVAKLTETSDFSFYDLQEVKTILYVKIPVKDNPVPALTATFFDQLISTLYQIGDQHGAVLKIPTILLLDEFANLGKLNDFDNTLSTCRGYDMSIMTIVQDFAQLEGKYSKELSRSIINNHDTTLFLRTKDVETAKYFERLAGDTTVNFSTKSSSNSGGFLYILGFGSSNPSKSTSEQYIKKPLISESQLLNMPPDKCFVFVTSHVIELEKAYQSKIFKGFITGTKKESIDGVMRFPYTYPQNREAYIKKFDLQPYKTVETKIIEQKPEPKIDIPTTNEQKLVPTPPDSREKGIQFIVSSFFDEIEKKEAKKKATVPDDSADVNEEVAASETKSSPFNGGGISLQESVDLSYMAVEDVHENQQYASDPAELAIFESAALIPEKIEKTNELVENIYEMKNLFEELSVSDTAQNPKIEDMRGTKPDIDLTDELPI